MPTMPGRAGCEFVFGTHGAPDRRCSQGGFFADGRRSRHGVGSRAGEFVWSALLVAGGIDKDLFKRGERVFVMFCKIPVDTRVCEESLDVFACGGEVEH